MLQIRNRFDKGNLMDLIVLREFLHSQTGQMLLQYLSDFMIETSVKANADAQWLKGMGMMIDHLKKVDEICREKNEINRR